MNIRGYLESFKNIRLTNAEDIEIYCRQFASVSSNRVRSALSQRKTAKWQNNSMKNIE